MRCSVSLGDSERLALTDERAPALNLELGDAAHTCSLMTPSARRACRVRNFSLNRRLEESLHPPRAAAVLRAASTLKLAFSAATSDAEAPPPPHRELGAAPGRDDVDGT